MSMREMVKKRPIIIFINNLLKVITTGRGSMAHHELDENIIVMKIVFSP